MDADIVCVGFGPATAGFLTTLSRQLVNSDGTPTVESAVAPGLPPQVLCYERADDLGFGVSGVVTKARALRASFPDLETAGIPMAAPVREEKVIYLLDPVGASRRTALLRLADKCIRSFKRWLPIEFEGLSLPWTPGFLHKHGGMVLSLGQFMQWAGAQLQSTGTVQLWPGTPVAQALLENKRVIGVRLLDQGVDKQGAPAGGFSPGMDIHAALTVVGDGPVGPVGRQLDAIFGLPPRHDTRDWAVGMKFVVDLPENTPLKPGTVLHTFGYPEPEIFGFFYVHPDRVASLGIFVPSWFDSPVRTSYRYLQHWMLHPYLWRYLKGGKLRSWGAKTLGESGRRGEPHLAGDGYARIGESSGSTNVLTGSGVDEAWATGAQLAQGVLELLKAKKPFTRENLEAAYVQRRRASWVEEEGRVAEKSRDGFQRGVLSGMLGMALAGLSRGRLAVPGRPLHPWERIPSLEDYYRGRIPPDEVRKIRAECYARGVSAHAALMERAGWPQIPLDGQVLVSHQDALLLGGKVQAPAAYADHVGFVFPELCRQCGTKLCVEICSGQAITPGENGVPNFDREKCIHCGACLWNCALGWPEKPECAGVAFRAGAGGLHSAEN
ncbi:Electron-transferring-flavoprotein dehydrogenase [Verrucomicrobia bacterium]|nr:Electron-transferring-flavoprotein dehydrogenase [Verrucomicrobiota bacterium]